MLVQPEKAKPTVMTIAHLHNCLRRSIHSTAVFTPSDTFVHEVDSKLVERTGEIRVQYFSSEKCPGGLLLMPKKYEMGMHNTARKKGVFYGKQIIRT